MTTTTETTDPDILMERLARLEKRISRLQVGMLLAVLLALGLAIAAWRQFSRAIVANTIFTGSVVLRGPGSSAFSNASLAADAEGNAKLVFMDAAARYRVGLGVKSDGTPALEFYDQRGKKRAWLGLTTDGEPVLELSKTTGKEVARMTPPNPSHVPDSQQSQRAQ